MFDNISETLTRRDKEVINFFAENGFTHSWDFSVQRDDIWNEFYFGGELICQIDIGVPLNCLIEDLKCWKHGKEPTSNYDYTVNIGSREKQKILLDNLKLPD